MTTHHRPERQTHYLAASSARAMALGIALVVRGRSRLVSRSYRWGVNDVEQFPVRLPFSTETDTVTL